MSSSTTTKSKSKKKKKSRQQSRNGELVPNFVAEWRQFRNFKSQNELSQASGVPSQTISRLEAYSLAYTYLTLRNLAKTLRCKPGDLISRHPLKDGHMLSQYDRLSPEQRDSVIDFVNGLVAKNGR